MRKPSWSWVIILVVLGFVALYWSQMAAGMLFGGAFMVSAGLLDQRDHRRRTQKVE